MKKKCEKDEKFREKLLVFEIKVVYLQSKTKGTKTTTTTTKQERDNKMKNNEIIKRAQAECGEYVTGYKGDITIDSLNAICEAMWNRAINLTYCFTEWLGEVLDVVGKKNFEFLIEEIQSFKNRKMQANKYYMFHGERYCA